MLSVPRGGLFRFRWLPIDIARPFEVLEPIKPGPAPASVAMNGPKVRTHGWDDGVAGRQNTQLPGFLHPGNADSSGPEDVSQFLWRLPV
jgi:hypothetical protein